MQNAKIMCKLLLEADREREHAIKSERKTVSENGLVAFGCCGRFVFIS